MVDGCFNISMDWQTTGSPSRPWSICAFGIMIPLLVAVLSRVLERVSRPSLLTSERHARVISVEEFSPSSPLQREGSRRGPVARVPHLPHVLPPQMSSPSVIFSISVNNVFSDLAALKVWCISLLVDQSDSLRRLFGAGLAVPCVGPLCQSWSPWLDYVILEWD